MPEFSDKSKRWATRITELRKKLGLNQAEFASRLGAKQGMVSKWESGTTKPVPDVFARMARIAPDENKFFFLDAAGIPSELFMGGLDNSMPSQMVEAANRLVSEVFAGDDVPAGKKVEMILVPILTDPIAAGNPLTIDDRDIDQVIPLPKSWMPTGGHIFGLKVEGDSMEPELHDGDWAYIDVKSRDVKSLASAGAMCAVRVDNGCTIKYLRKSGSFYQLVPQNTSRRHEIKILTAEDNWAVLGEVVWRMGRPPKPPTPKGKK